MTGDFEARVGRVAALHDPVRRALYQVVAGSPGAVSREQAATAAGVKKALAAFHLDKLAAEGLLEVEYRRLTGRTGPGAGRPSKLYRRADRETEISLPPREYDLAGHLLATAIEAAESSGRSVRAELEQVAVASGRSIGEQARPRLGSRPSKAKRRSVLLDVLRDHGFEPREVGGEVVLANCPFHALAQQFTDLVCGMNLHLLDGVRVGLAGGDDLQPRLEPEPGQCCVKFRGATTGR